VYTGLANLTVSITAVGYINDNGDFVADSTIDHDQRLAVKILVTNTGTNKTGEWRIHTVVPTRTDSTFEHDENEPNLEPNGILPLTLTLERGQPHIGDDEKISVEVDTDNDVDESNENDNDATATISVN
jgi:subtilase family serine protease